VIHIHYDEYKTADPGSIGWAMDRQVFRWVVPFHEGAVRYFKSIGVWDDATQAHNDRLIQRQDVLAQAWQVHKASYSGREGFAEAWLEARVAALDANGFDPVWR